MDVRRDPELEDVLLDLEGRLASIADLRGRTYEDRLAVIETLAGPYAIAFLHEIRRLDALVRPCHWRSNQRHTPPCREVRRIKT